MTIDKAEVARLIDIADHLPDSGEFAQLATLAEVIGCTVACALAEGVDALEVVELVLTAAKPSRDSLRAAERVLRRLGYAEVANLVRRHAKRVRRVDGAWPRRPGRIVGRLVGRTARALES